MVVRCTRKLLEQLLNHGVAPAEPAPADDDWYANLLWLDRRKCLLLTHAGTLFAIFRAGIRKRDLRPIGSHIVTTVEAELRAENLPLDTFGLLDPEDVRLAKTASRSILGFMNEMTLDIRYQVAAHGGLERCHVDLLNHRLRRTASTSVQSNSWLSGSLPALRRRAGPWPVRSRSRGALASQGTVTPKLPVD